MLLLNVLGFSAGSTSAHASPVDDSVPDVDVLPTVVTSGPEVEVEVEVELELSATDVEVEVEV